MSGISITEANKTAIAQTLKAHRATIENAPTQDAWTDCDGLVCVADECSGDSLELQVDGKTIKVLVAGVYNFGGCIHYQNNTGGDKTPLVAGRILIKGTTEAKCSQRAKKLTQKTGGEDTISYNGTATFAVNDTFVLQYYVDDNTIDFISNSVFDDPVAWTVWAKHIGIKG